MYFKPNLARKKSLIYLLVFAMIVFINSTENIV